MVLPLGKVARYDITIYHVLVKYACFVLGMATSCFEFSILELWGHNGNFDQKSDREIENLTQEQILQKINTQNTRYLN